jgi:hypothetical protein
VHVALPNTVNTATDKVVAVSRSKAALSQSYISVVVRLESLLAVEPSASAIDDSSDRAVSVSSFIDRLAVSGRVEVKGLRFSPDDHVAVGPFRIINVDKIEAVSVGAKVKFVFSSASVLEIEPGSVEWPGVVSRVGAPDRDARTWGSPTVVITSQDFGVTAVMTTAGSFRDTASAWNFDAVETWDRPVDPVDFIGVDKLVDTAENSGSQLWARPWSAVAIEWI